MYKNAPAGMKSSTYSNRKSAGSYCERVVARALLFLDSLDRTVTKYQNALLITLFSKNSSANTRLSLPADCRHVDSHEDDTATDDGDYTKSRRKPTTSVVG